jgi:opacity protein-like surface antigen
MKRLALAALVVVAASAPAFADVTIKSTVTGKGMGMSGTMATTTYIKGNKMRSDTVAGDTTRTTIFDVDTQKMITFDSKKKEADVYDMQRMAEDMAKNVTVSDMKATVTPNGKTRDVAGRSATGYDMEITLPATMGGPGGMKMTVHLTGPIWVVKGAPGTQEYLAFYKNAVEKGWFFTDPRSAKAQPGQAKAMAEVYRQLAATDGIAYEQEMNIKMSGEGPMAGMLARMGNISTTQTITSVDTAALAADLFAPPAGYKLKEQK